MIRQNRLQASKTVNQYPWNLSKLKKALKRRKWFRIKFNSQLLKGRKFFRKKFLKTYENKTKQLFKKFFSPGVTQKQFKKLFKFKNRFRSTFRQILKLENRLDTLVLRVYFLPNIELARHSIINSFFVVNNLKVVSPKFIVNIGDIIEINNKSIWSFFYIHYMKVISSIKKYYNRILFKVSYPFIPKRKKKLFKEDRWAKRKAVNYITKRIGKRFLLVRRKSQKKYIQLTFKASDNSVDSFTIDKLKKTSVQKRKPMYYIKKLLNNYNYIFFKRKSYLKKKKFHKRRLKTAYRFRKKSKKAVIHSAGLPKSLLNTITKLKKKKI